MEADLRALEQRFLKLIPLLQHLARGGSGSSINNTNASQTRHGLKATDNKLSNSRLQELECSVSELRQKIYDKECVIDVDKFAFGDNCVAQINEMQAQINNFNYEWLVKEFKLPIKSSSLLMRSLLGYLVIYKIVVMAFSLTRIAISTTPPSYKL